MSVWFKRVLLAGAVLALLAGGSAEAQAQGRGQGNGAGGDVVQLRPTGPVPDQYIVVFKDDVTDPRGLANALSRRNGFAVQHVYEFALKGFAGNMPAPVAEALAQDPDVAYVEQDVYAHAILHENNFQTLPSGVKRIDADLNPLAANPVDVDIAILDTGVDFDHPDLNVFHRVDCAKGGPFTQKCRDGEGDDGYGHGTHVAGSAAALDNSIGVVGVAPGARIWSLKVLGDDGSGWFSWSVAALDYVTANAATIEVVNMSLGGQGTLDSLRTAIQSAVNAGVVVVVAAGNELRDVYGSNGFGTGDESIPASYPEAMAVSAMADFDGEPGGNVSDQDSTVVFNVCPHEGDDVFACFTNFSNSVVAGNPVTSPGLAIDVAGPGLNIISTYMDGMYATMSGTSMASPHVAGAVALYIAANGRANDAAGVAAIRQALIDAAEAQTDWRDDDDELGLVLATGDPDGNLEGLVNALGGPVNITPVVSITAPADGDTFESDATINFTGSAADDEDGDLTADLEWISDLDGPIGSGGSPSAALSDGTHVITASVIDSGDKTGTASVNITVGTPNLLPTVTIMGPNDGVSFDSGATVNFSGSASDPEDLNITASLIWTSDRDGEIGTGGNASMALSNGTHVITASVTDSDGDSDSASISVTMGTAPTSVGVASIAFGRHGGRNGTKHLLVIVAVDDNLGNPVEGASVSVTVTGPKGGSGSGATLADGTVTFSLKNAPICNDPTTESYTTNVTNVTIAGLTWNPSDLADPANTETDCI